MNIKIITDSASDMGMAARDGLEILPMTITFGGQEFKDGINLSHHEFYEKLVEGDELPHTSQITPFAFDQAFQKAVQEGQEVVVITMSAKLSGTWQSAVTAANDYKGKVFVVDSENVTVGERVLVEYALRLRQEGLSAHDIAEKLEQVKKRCVLWRCLIH